MTELLPCPFCGGEAEKMTSSDGFTSIGCLSCNPLFGIMIQRTTEAEAIAAWNTRAYTTDELTLSGMYAHGLPIEDVRVFGMTLDEVRQMMKRDAERERTCELICHEVELPDSLKDADFEMYVYECSECGEAMFSNYNYCPNCGAKVVGE